MLRPRSIAMIGGKMAERAIRQCDLMGFEGEIWPVNPHRDEMYSRPCFRSIQDLPRPPDAAFVAVPREPTIKVVGELAAAGAGGVICYASGFAEVGGKGIESQKDLDAARGDMPLIGPNCYGMLNYQDGVALWPDEQGGVRCQRGAAIISQSGNITVSLTMQRRGVPVVFLISTGNMTGVKTHDYIHAMLENPGVTAIGLYLEGVVDASEFSVAAIEALKKRVPIVVLESGQSTIGANVTRTHSYSLSTDGQVSSAFYQKFGIIQVHSIPQLLETLKLVSLIPPEDNPSIASISCSGGEAALMADLVAKKNLEFAELSDTQRRRLYEVLGDRVVVSNPLDYHTYIWGDQAAQTECFQAVYEGSQNINVNVIDFPIEGICDPVEWGAAIQAIKDAKDNTGANVVAVSTLHENFPPKYQSTMLEHSIPPMVGMVECVDALADSVEFARKANSVSSLMPLIDMTPCRGVEDSLDEFEGKQQLLQAGIPVVAGELVNSVEEAVSATSRIGYPVVAKISSVETIHKSDVGGVILDIQSDDDLIQACESIFRLSDAVLIEPQLPAPIIEMLVAFRVDATFGPIMVIGAGGKLANLLQDSAVLHFPILNDDIQTCLNQLRIGKLLSGYRGIQGDMTAVLRFIRALARFAIDEANKIIEIEVNPLFVYAPGAGVKAVDVVYRFSE